MPKDRTPRNIVTTHLDQVIALIAAADAVKRPEIGTAAALAFWLFLRESEVLAIRAWDFDGTSLLLPSRCKLWSRVKPSPELCDRLQTLLDTSHSRKGARKEEPWGDPRAFRRVFARLRRQAGLPVDLTFRALRSSGVLTFRQSGVMPAWPAAQIRLRRAQLLNLRAPSRSADPGAAAPSA